MITLTKLQPFQTNIYPKDQLFLQAQPSVSSKQPVYYPFVNLIRFVSMLGVVWAHVAIFTGYKSEQDFLNTVGHEWLYISFKQLFKFGVICFFMISGFLLGDMVKPQNLVSYYKRRLQSTLKPYLVVFFIFVLHLSLKEYFKYHTFSGIEILRFCLFTTHLWYLPNYLIALFVTLIFYKFLDSKVFGSTLFLITLLYSVLTVYTIKYQASNTYALFGFVFYLWLGIYIRRNNKVLEKIKQIKLIPLTIFLVVVFLLSCTEAYKLYLNSFDHVNILRIFNQLYSVTMFIFLIRICNSTPNFGFLNPRKETYGIYLYHGLIAYYLVPRSVRYLFEHHIFDSTAHNIYSFMGYHLLFFGITYLSTTLLVKVLLKFNLGFLQQKVTQYNLKIVA
jgi:hypothetical protein